MRSGGLTWPRLGNGVRGIMTLERLDCGRRLGERKSLVIGN